MPSRLISHLIALCAVTGLSFTFAPRILAADPSASRPVAAPNTSERDPVPWDAVVGAPDAVIWSRDVYEIGSLAVAGDKVLVGGKLPDSRYGKGRGLLLCLSIDTGKELWRVTHAALPERIHDMVACIASTPFVDGGSVYYLSNRGELCCVRLEDGHAVWSLDIPKDLNVFKRDPNDIAQQAPSPIVVGDLVYCVTGNGVRYVTDNTGREVRIVPCPNAPSFLAVDKRTGKLIWSSNAPGKDIILGQWATPTYATLDGAGQILFPGGDGLLYAFEPRAGKLLWKVDCKDPKGTETHDFTTAPPLVVGDTAVVSPAWNIDMSSWHGPHRLLGINLRTHAIRWSFLDEHFHGTYGRMASANGIVYAAGGYLVAALDINTGKPIWTTRTQERIYSGLTLHQGSLYASDGTGQVIVLSAKDGKQLHRWECDQSAYQGTPAISNGKLIVVTGSSVLALRLPE